MRSTGWLAIVALLGTPTSALHADPLESMAARLAKGAVKLDSRRVAVLTFTYPDGAISTGSSLVAETLTTQLVGRKKITVIERSQLSKILSEQRLELSGVTESSGTDKLGRILGVDAIVTGTLQDTLNGPTHVNARMIRATTGEVLAAAAANIDRTWEDTPHMPLPASNADPETLHMSQLIPVSQGNYRPAPRRSIGGFPPPARLRRHTP